MPLGTLLPLALLCIGTKIVHVHDEDVDGNVQVGFLRTPAPKQTSHIVQQISWLLSLLQIICPYWQAKLLQYQAVP